MPHPDTSKHPAGGDTARLPVFDLIRGVAVLGILPVNISVFSGVGLHSPSDGDHWAGDLLTVGVMLFFEGKMVTLLSILFGVGLAMQSAQAHFAGRPFAPFGRRRMIVLFFFGLAHALLLFHFDILTSYAVLGLIALLFLQRPDRVLVRVAAVCFTWSFGLVLLVATVIAVASLWLESSGGALETLETPAPSHTSPSEVQSQEPGHWLESLFDEETDTQVFRDGSFGEMVLHRAVYLGLLIILFWLETGWYMLGCILVGVWLVRRGAFQSVDGGNALFRRFIGYGVAVGLLFHAGAIAAYLHDPDNMYSWCLIALGCLPLALGYLGLLKAWAQSGRAAWLQSRLRDVGRMSLSNYLMQSILCGFVFYGYGLGLYKQMDQAATLGVVLAVWILLTLGSWLWLKRFRYGPAEWLWRILTGRLSHSQ